jgi:hypothetical protein
MHMLTHVSRLSCGTGGDWVFEGGVVTFAEVVAAWTSVHGDGGLIWQRLLCAM